MMNDYISYLQKHFPEKDSLLLVKKEAEDYMKSHTKEECYHMAMAFDNHCKAIGYEEALPLINEWLASVSANVRRAVTEGLRIWTSRPYLRNILKLLLLYWSNIKKMKVNMSGNR